MMNRFRIFNRNPRGAWELVDDSEYPTDDPAEAAYLYREGKNKAHYGTVCGQLIPKETGEPG